MLTAQHRFLDVRLLEAIDGIPAGTMRAVAMRGGGEERLIDADGRDLLLVRIPGRVHYPVDRVKALETPGWQAALDWSLEEAVAMQIAFRVVHPEISRWSAAVGGGRRC